MTRQEALSLLTDTTPRNRLRGARLLQAEAEPGDLVLLTTRLQQESDAHVRRALVRAILRIKPDFGSPVELPPIAVPGREQGLIEDIAAEMMDEVATTLLHEISPLVGAISEAATREFDNFATSRTKETLDRLTDLLEAIAELRRAASPPDLVEFDLTDLVVKTLEDEGKVSDTRIRPARHDPVMVSGAVAHVRLAFCNGLRNAVDAIDALGASGEGEVVINWGIGDDSGWISVLDNGIGLPEGGDKVFEYGSSTKSKKSHSGFGLPIALRAMKSVGGRLTLTPREGGGTAFGLSWPLASDLL